MSRPLGSKNKNSSNTPLYIGLPTGEKITVLANLIIDLITEDQANGQRLLKEIMEVSDE